MDRQIRICPFTQLWCACRRGKPIVIMDQKEREYSAGKAVRALFARNRMAECKNPALLVQKRGVWRALRDSNPRPAA